MKTTLPTIADVPDNLLAGQIVLWSWGSHGTPGFTRSDLEHACVYAGFDTAILPSELSATRAFKRAVADVRREYDAGDSRILFTQVQDDDEWGLVVACRIGDLSTSERDAIEHAATIGPDAVSAYVQKELGPQAGGWFRLNKASGTVSRGGDASWTGVLDCFDRAFAARGGLYTVRDIRLLQTRLLRDIVSAIPLRRGGGAWFVPSHAEACLARCRDFLKQILANSSGGTRSGAGAATFDAHAIPMLRVPESAEMVEDAATADAECLFTEVERALEDLDRRVEAGTSVKESTIDLHAGRADSYIEELEITAELLGFTIDDLRERVATIEARAARLRERRDEIQNGK